MRFVRRIALGVVVLQLCLLAVAQTPRPRRIAVFGSSVAYGTGDETRKGGYTGLLREALSPKGWEVVNVSRPGDTTRTAAARWSQVTAANPRYLVIALALSNEGLLEAETTEEKEAVFEQMADGIRGFVDRARASNIVPIVNLMYPRMTYTPVEYAYVKRMNLLLNTWDVPSVNLLGALDDGAGRYVRAFDTDDKHPNAAGHRELSFAFVPSLFEALEKEKARPAKPAGDLGFARVSAGTPPLSFEPQETMHSFALSFDVRAQGGGNVATLSGSTTLDRDFNSALVIESGKWAYKAADGSISSSQVSADAQWHKILLSHYTARGETLLFVDGKLAAKASERLQPKRFALGGPRPGDYKDLFIYRSALNADEAGAIASGALLQASLEIYAPLADAQFENRAQSLSSLKAEPGRIVHVVK